MLKCRMSDVYRGERPPQCNEGKGCEACNAKYISRIRAEMNRRARANITPTSPSTED